MTKDKPDSGSRSLLLYHEQCPMATVRLICLFAEMVHVPIEQDPPGNLASGPTWGGYPERKQAGKAPKKIETGLEF